jgi:hypothetical protein
MQLRHSHCIGMAAAIWVGGCTTSITPPADPDDPVPIFVIDYGRHSSLVLPDPRAPAGRANALVEYTYGDWNWFALDRHGWHHVFPTLFWPTRGTLGHRRLSVAPEPAAIRRLAPYEHLHPITVSAARASDLAAQLHAQFERHRDSLHHHRLYDLDFVPSESAFHLFHNCNHVVARWLRQLDCQVRGPALTADFVVRQRGNSDH